MMKKVPSWYFDDATDKGNWDDTTGAQDGDLAVQVDTQVLYVWDQGTTAWVEALAAAPTITIATAHDDNGYGSTNTLIRRISNQVHSADATWTNSSVNGDYLTIDSAGWYVINYTLLRTAAGVSNTHFSICVNTSLSNTWSKGGIRNKATQTIEDNGSGSMRVTLELAVNDLVWFMCEDASINNAGDLYGTRVSLTRIG